MRFLTLRRRWTAGMVAVAAVLVVGATSASSTAEVARASSSDELTFAFPGYSTTTMTTYLADDLGYFKKLGLAVKIMDGQGANVASEIVSGQADLGSLGLPTPLTIRANGADLVTVYEDNGGGNAGFMVGSPTSAPTISALKSLKSCRIAVFGTGNPVYGYGNIYKQKLGLSNCTLASFGSVALELGAVASGNCQAAIASYPTVATALAAHQVDILVDTRQASVRKKYVGTPFIEGVEAGIYSNLEAKRSAVIKWLKGVNMAREWLSNPKHTNAQAAALLAKSPGFALDTLPVLTGDVAASRAVLNLGSTNGYITANQWLFTLNQIGNFGLAGYNAGNGDYSYARAVNMLFYKAAIGVPKVGASTKKKANGK